MFEVKSAEKKTVFAGVVCGRNDWDGEEEKCFESFWEGSTYTYLMLLEMPERYGKR